MAVCKDVPGGGGTRWGGEVPAVVREADLEGRHAALIVEGDGEWVIFVDEALPGELRDGVVRMAKVWIREGRSGFLPHPGRARRIISEIMESLA